MVIKMKKSLTFIAVVALTLLLAVPAFAAETADATTDSNPQIVYDEPDLGEVEASDRYFTLPDAPEKEGYTFQGWRVNGGSDLYNAGDLMVKDGSEEIHLQPVYEADVGAKADDSSVSSSAKDEALSEIANKVANRCLILFIVLIAGLAAGEAIRRQATDEFLKSSNK